MQVIDRQDVAPVVTKPESRIARLRRTLAFRLGAVFSIVVGLVGGTASLASAAPAVTPDPTTDLTAGSGDTFFSSLTSYFTGHVLISVLALLALVVGAGMLISWGRKAAKAK